MSSRTPDPGVVVGVNGSGNSLRAVRWAAAEARREVPLRTARAPFAALGILDEQRAVDPALARRGRPPSPVPTNTSTTSGARSPPPRRPPGCCGRHGSRRGCDGARPVTALDVRRGGEVVVGARPA
jgi:hypothetical protein